MNKSSANLIALGQRELRSMGEKCDPACFVWYGCGNSKPDGVCAGFLLLDGETRRHLNHMLSEDNEKYVVNCMRMLQNGSKEESLVSEVLRYMPQDWPSVCDTRCPHTQCSSWGNQNAMGKPCRNVTLTNEELRRPQTRSAEEDQAILQSIPRNSRLGQVLDRLDTLEKNIAEAEKIVKDPIVHMHVAKNRPNFCKPKRLDGFDEE